MNMKPLRDVVGLSASLLMTNITDFGVKCKSCGTINTITLEKGELKKQV